MTEEEWLECTDPTPMLKFVQGKVSDRKLRLFAVACCRLVVKKVRVSPVAEHKVDVAERYADGAASTEELASFANPHRCADDAALIEKLAHARYSKDAHFACLNAAEIEGGGIMADCAAGNAAWASAKHEAEPPHDNGLSLIFNARLAVEQGNQCSLLRDIIGNPFRLVTLNPGWLTPTVVQLAQAIYNDRAFDRLPILADALHEAGCDNEEILDHCRGAGPHVRGCWVVDLLLGKQ